MKAEALTALSAVVFCLAIGSAAPAQAGPSNDGDGDGILDVLDKCTLDSRNATAPATCDTDQDGYGNVCDADFDQSFGVNPTDFSMHFLPRFKTGVDTGTLGTDMDCGDVNPTGLLELLRAEVQGSARRHDPGAVRSRVRGSARLRC